jgi:autotransporter-associated beta strand protein
LQDDDSLIRITSIESPHVIRTGETDLDDDEDGDDPPMTPPNPWAGYSAAAIRNIQFGPAPARFLTLAGTNSGDNTLTPIVGDASDRDEVIAGETPGGEGGQGSVGIRKTGTGTWVLAGANTYTGETRVLGGTLKVTGTTGSGATIVSNGATLMGDDVGGELIVEPGGTVNPGLSPGTMTVQGNYTLGIGGRQTVEIAGTGTSQYDRLIVLGEGEEASVGTGDPVEGDYNENGFVDGADYAVWRDAMTAGLSALPNRNPDYTGLVGEQDFVFWRTNFGDMVEDDDGDDDATEAREAAILAGSIFIDLLSFSPSVGNMFTVLTAESITNNGLSLAGESAGFNLIVNPTSVVLHYVGGGGAGSGSAAIPEPSSILLGGVALVGLIGMTRRRHPSA